MKRLAVIPDVYDDELTVTYGAVHEHVFLDAECGSESTCLALDYRGVKKLRRALKRALKEMSA